MPNTPQLETLLLCTGKACFKKQSSAFRSLEDGAHEAGIPTSAVDCQGSCAGPTAVVAVDGSYRWFEKLQKSTVRADLLDLASGKVDKPSKRLRGHELTGKARKKAARKLKA